MSEQLEKDQLSPESRLLNAGFMRQMENWTTPDGKRALSQEDAIEALDVGEVEGWTMNVPSGGVYAFSDEEVEKILRQLPAWEPLVDIFRDAVREVVREELRRSRRKT